MATSKYIRLSYLKKNASLPAWTVTVESYPTQAEADNRIMALDDPTVATNFNTAEVDYA